MLLIDCYVPTTVSTDSNFDTYEEWAFKVGDFGSNKL